MTFRSIAAVSVILFITLLSGCGRKTALVPPQRLVPESIKDLRYVLDEKGVTLRWSYPVKMENGDPLHAIDSFEVQRAAIPGEDFCQGCPVQYDETVEIDGGQLPSTGEVRTASYSEGYLQDGYHYFYKVSSRAGWWYPSEDSNVVSFVWRIPPGIPQGLVSEPGDRAIVLKWEPVTDNVKGFPLAEGPAYQIYRKSDDNDFVVLGDPVKDTKFTDKVVTNGKTYFYRIRAEVTSDGTLHPGAFSRVVSDMPRDLAPPAKPENLVAIEVPGGVKLAWQAVEDADLAGYRIYRRAEGAAKREFIAEVGAGQDQYIDRSAAHGEKWFYSVTSFDSSQPVNESIPAEEASVYLK